MAFADNNNSLYENVMKQSDVKETKFSLLENKKSGKLTASVRDFKHTEGYDGPTRNGMMLQLNTVEDVEKYQKAFNDFFEKVKEFF
jgi:hypothetical protein